MTLLEASSDNSGSQTTGGTLSKNDRDLIIILSTVSGIFLIIGLIGTYIRRKRQHKKQTDMVEWPVTDVVTSQSKRRSETWPANQEQQQRRPRLHSGISLSSLSRGGEVHGKKVDVFLT